MRTADSSSPDGPIESMMSTRRLRAPLRESVRIRSRPAFHRRVRSAERVGWRVGTLYAVNTFGAVLGAGAAGFLLIPALGVAKTIYLASLLNFIVCGLGWWLHRRSQAATALEAPAGKRQARKPASEPQTQRIPAYGRAAVAVVLVGYALSGFAALVYEIAWTRVLALLFVSTVYAFSLMLTAFILGLAAGAMAGARFADRLRDPMRALAAVEVAIGLSALLVVPVIGWLPFFVTGVMSQLAGSFWKLQGAQLGLILLIMLVPTTLMGAAFPLASRLVVRRPEAVGRSVGVVYASNTLGSIAGSFVGGFVLIPWLGLQQTILAAVSANILTGCALLGVSRSVSPFRRGLVAGAVLVVAALVIGAVPAWDASRMSLGPFATAWKLPAELAQSREALERIARRDNVLLHREGLSTTVTVKEDPNGVLMLLINGIPEASSVGRLHQQQLLAHIPLLLHPDPRRALVIGLASGMTLGSAGTHPLEALDCVELSGGVVEATRLFGPYNHHILDDPRVRLIITDGRNYVALSAAQYDVIISQPSNLWIAGVADLFTREFFELCRERLTDGGIACIWFETATIDLDLFRSIVRTFQSVFKELTIWQASRSDYLLVGAKGELVVDEAALARRISEEAVAADLQRIDVETVPELLAFHVMGTDAAARFVAGAALHTDDNALLEFAAPRSLGRRGERAARVEAIERYREADFPWLTGVDPEHLTATREEAARLIEAKGHVARARALRARGEDTEAIAALGEAARLNPADPGLRNEIPTLGEEAAVLFQAGRLEASIERYRLLVGLDPDNDNLHYQLGLALAVSGRTTEALDQLREAARLRPDRAQLLNDTAWILATRLEPGGNGGEAVRLAERAAALTQHREAAVLDTLAAAYAAAGRFEQAVSTADRAAALATSARNDALAADIQIRLELYRRGEAYRE